MNRWMSVLVCVGILAGLSAPAAARGSFYDWWVNESTQREQLIAAIKEKLKQINQETYSVEGTTDTRPVSPTPEPSSALVFGAGLLVASQIARKRRR